MFRILKNLFDRRSNLWEIITADLYVYVTRSQKNGRPTTVLGTNLVRQNHVILILEDAASQLKAAEQTTDSLLNTLGIKRQDEL